MAASDWTIHYGKTLSEAELNYVEQQFSKQAYQLMKLPPVESFCITLYNAEQKLMATTYGSIYYGCMYIDTIFVDENLRKQGHGKELLLKAENLAREKLCNFITVATMDFEARPFYEKLGYFVEYERSGYMNQAIMYCLRKNLV